MTILRISVFLATLLMLSLSGCAWFGDKPEISPAKQREALEVPPDLARPAGDDLASVPPSGAAAYSDYAAKTPAASAGSTVQASTTGKTEVAASGNVRLERDGAQRWLVALDSSESMWVKARNYFLRNKISLTEDNPQGGVLETDWIDRPVKYTGTFSKLLSTFQSTDLRDKYRVRVEPGRIPGTAEVTVSHKAMAQMVTNNDGSSATQINWQPLPADPEMEADMLAKLLVHFGLDELQAKGLIATTDGERAQLVKGELIIPREDLDSAWRRVGQMLDRAGVITEDRDRSAGIFYVRYVDSGQASKRQGLFGWLRSDSDSSPDAKNEAPSDRFQVRLKTTTAGTSVAVFNVKGEPDNSTAGEQLLGVLHQQLR